MKYFKWVVAALMALTLAGGVQAQAYPSKTVRVVVGFAPGGGTDIVGRLIALELSRAWGEQFVVENKPGATGMIGANEVAKAHPDGYTLLLGHVNSQAIAPYFTRKPLYDPQKDFAPVAYIGYVPNVLVINPATPAKNLKELTELARTRAAGLTFASPGVGSTNHLAGEMFGMQSGIKLTHVPYKGSSPAIVDLMAGRIDMNFDAMSSIVPFLKEGRMRAIAITTPTRDRDLPDVPTMAESGFKGFEVTNWYGVVAPAGTPPEIVNKLNVEINRILQLPAIAAKLNELGVRRNAMSAKQFGDFIRSENDKYRDMAKKISVRMD